MARYVAITPQEDGSLASTTTGLLLRREADRLRLVNATTGEAYLWPEEADAELRRLAEARQAAEARAHAEEAWRRDVEARLAAEARAAVVEEELARLRRELQEGSLNR